MRSAEAIIERASDFLASVPGAAEKATAAALNRATAAGREEAIASILDRYAAKPSDVRAAVSVTVARAGSLDAEVVAVSGSLALDYFPHTPERGGTGGRGRPALRAEVVRGNMRDVQGAFVAPINGRQRIMIRTGQKTATGRSQIRKVSAVPIAVMMGHETVRQAVESRSLAVFDEQVDKQIDRALKDAD